MNGPSPHPRRVRHLAKVREVFVIELTALKKVRAQLDDTFDRALKVIVEPLMKTICLLLTAACTFALTSCTTMKKSNTSLSPLKTETTSLRISRKVEMRYLVYLPKDYDPKNGQRWPLMLFLHGAGERGTNIQNVAIHGPLSWVKKGKDFPFVIVAPLCAEGRLWENEPLLKLLERIPNQFAVDTNRVYLTGLSMGGYGTWNLGVAHPEQFAAIVPICGGGETIDVLLAAGERADALKKLPVWAFHGAKDTVVPPEESERMVRALKKLGCREVKLTIYPEANHDSWTETYNNPEVYEWLLQHQRK